ncbi:hypothetical protein EYF80_027310 [Liparis tanakae]|uniref:Uncharacterized protein n=1 Tax=Liparis tanakae TaxID=230148 RepID=A0A4Z2H9D2_9TELE|nr:hypothetical protein EYF80_027310 [Liparis tanakae]
MVELSAPPPQALGSDARSRCADRTPLKSGHMTRGRGRSFIPMDGFVLHASLGQWEGPLSVAELRVS